MAIEVTEDLIDGNQASLDSGGYKITRTFYVKGLDAVASGKSIQALTATGIPAYGDAHPDNAGLFVYSLSAQCTTPTQAKVTVLYGIRSTNIVPDDTAPAQISVGSALTSSQTNEDIGGNVIQVAYGTNDPKPTTVEVQVPVTTLRLSRLEPNDPLSNALAYVGKLNSGTFHGMAAGTVLCTRIEGTSADGGDSYTVNYEFTYRPEGWDATVIWTDENGNVPNDGSGGVASDYGRVVDGKTGVADFVMYDSADFSLLNV